LILLNVENSAKLEKKIAAGIFGIFFVAGFIWLEILSQKMGFIKQNPFNSIWPT